ncbi:axoneme-associated protein mst101(2)-like [Dorcoceras hygrometricum]|uniref:Axoneme-associated protein mst101(2)-like n=1 Tax=Dorcoceras hygrometricum TaxID=472368 RepID=A0A2Z7CVS1_9LAMI|nr:axoneme-associated protein mst101(2)-like [Dorcoceras hygrometricum]
MLRLVSLWPTPDYKQDLSKQIQQSVHLRLCATADSTSVVIFVGDPDPPPGEAAEEQETDCGSLRQSGPRPGPRLLRQAALEALTRSARTNTPRKTRPEQFPAKWRRRRAVHGGGVSWEGREAATLMLRV